MIRSLWVLNIRVAVSQLQARFERYSLLIHQRLTSALNTWKQSTHQYLSQVIWISILLPFASKNFGIEIDAVEFGNKRLHT